MANQHSLDAQLRTVLGKKVKRLRHEGLLPATVYGKGISPLSIQLNLRTFNSMYRQVGRSALVELTIPNQPLQSAFIHAVQRHPVSRAIIHVDFLVVDLRVEITVEVPITYTGESPLVERGDAVLNTVANSLAVRALPASLPQHINVDLSSLDELDKSIHVRDLAPSGDYTIMTDPDELLVSLGVSRANVEDEAEAAEAAAAAEPELIREERDEDEG
ncbi:MAG: 50S ribosomal protein L25 [Chloroflexales bacterium]|nr:50S ribosomal protein L25 [Chloroflexales bacterium]